MEFTFQVASVQASPIRLSLSWTPLPLRTLPSDRHRAPDRLRDGLGFRRLPDGARPAGAPIAAGSGSLDSSLSEHPIAMIPDAREMRRREIAFLLGPAGSGKTRCCLERLIGSEVAGQPALYLVPEQSTYLADRQLL